MIISKIKILLLVSTISFCSAVAAMPTSSQHGCNQKTEKATAAKINSPSWWNWITGGKNASQFHFFDLIELLHKDDADVSAKTEIPAENEDKSDA